MAENFLAMGIGFLVTVLVARTLGPEEFGVLAYAISMVSLIGVAGHMGLSGLIVREIVQKPDESGVTLGTAIILKFIGMLAGFSVLLIYALLYEKTNSIEFLVLMIIGAGILFKPLDVVDFWFQAHVQARYTAIARISSLLLSSALKLLFVLLGLGVLYFALANLVQVVLAGCILLLIYRFTSVLNIKNWRFDFLTAKKLLSEGWVVYLGSVFAVIYLKSDQVMLRWMVGSEEVGVYAVAAQLSEAWYFVPTAIVASVFPRLIKLKAENPEQFHKRLQQIFDLLFILAFCVALLFSFLSESIVKLFFGQHYLASSVILIIHIWSALFIFMRAAFSKWILIEGVLVFSLITQGMGAAVNIIFNLILIPRFGGAGAAIATLVSYAMASYLSLFFCDKTRPVFWMMSKAMLSPVRYPLGYLKGKWA